MKKFFRNEDKKKIIFVKTEAQDGKGKESSWPKALLEAWQGCDSLGSG